jgi:hypothetical protein
VELTLYEEHAMHRPVAECGLAGLMCLLWASTCFVASWLVGHHNAAMLSALAAKTEENHIVLSWADVGFSLLVCGFGSLLLLLPQGCERLFSPPLCTAVCWRQDAGLVAGCQSTAQLRVGAVVNHVT